MKNTLLKAGVHDAYELLLSNSLSPTNYRTTMSQQTQHLAMSHAVLVPHPHLTCYV